MLASGERSVWLAARLARIRGTPWIAVGHGTEFGTRNRWERALTRGAFGAANAVVCVSEYTRSRMHAAGVHGRREHVIPNGADPSAFRILPATADSRRSAGSVLLTVGNVTERKGQEVVIRALPDLPGVRYEMIGLPTRAPELAALARELGVADRIEFVGRASQEELVRRLNACDLFVMTSRNTAGGDFEGFGIAVVEAALCGKPAIVSSGSGLSEAIIAGETALIVREGESADTARAIKELLADPARLRRMGAAANAHALAEQTWPHRAERYDAVLRDAMRPQGRKIVVISDTPHYRRAGRIVGWGPTVRELDQLSTLFDELVHVAPVSDEAAPASALPYESPRVRIRPLRPSGGERLVDKFGILNCAPEYLGIALSEMKDAEVVHLRCPASVSMLVAFVLPFLRRPAKRWIKYAGNWNPRDEEPVSYELQRRWLMKPWHRALVTVNGNWPGQPAARARVPESVAQRQGTRRGAGVSGAEAVRLSGAPAVRWAARRGERGAGRAGCSNAPEPAGLRRRARVGGRRAVAPGARAAGTGTRHFGPAEVLGMGTARRADITLCISAFSCSFPAEARGGPRCFPRRWRSAWCRWRAG